MTPQLLTYYFSLGTNRAAVKDSQPVWKDAPRDGRLFGFKVYAQYTSPVVSAQPALELRAELGGGTAGIEAPDGRPLLRGFLGIGSSGLDSLGQNAPGPMLATDNPRYQWDENRPGFTQSVYFAWMGESASIPVLAGDVIRVMTRRDAPGVDILVDVRLSLWIAQC